MFYPSSCVFVYACLGKDYANVAILLCRGEVGGSCFVRRLVFSSTLALESIMPSSRCVV